MQITQSRIESHTAAASLDSAGKAAALLRTRRATGIMAGSRANRDLGCSALRSWSRSPCFDERAGHGTCAHTHCSRDGETRLLRTDEEATSTGRRCLSWCGTGKAVKCLMVNDS